MVRADEDGQSPAMRICPATPWAPQIGTTGALAIQDVEGVELKEYDTIDLALMDLVER